MDFLSIIEDKKRGRALTKEQIACFAAGAAALGLNCSPSPEDMLSLLRAMRRVSALPVVVQPNAGMPETAPDGSTLDVPYERMVPAAVLDMSYADIVAAAYALDTDATMTKAQRLFGKVISIDTAWSDEYQNITVTIQVGELADQPIQCFRLTGEGAKDLKEGDEITVEGILKNYQGTVEFDKGCVLVGFGEIISQAATLLVFLIAAVFSAFGYGAAGPMIQAYCIKSVPPDKRGVGSSAQAMGLTPITNFAPAACAISPRSAASSIWPKKFGCWT